MAVVAACWPVDAEACFPWWPHVAFTSPFDGDSHPSNASVLVVGQVLDPDGLAVEVDGADASLVVGPRSWMVDFVEWGSFYRVIELSVEPTPGEGQTVRVFGELCPPETHPSTLADCSGFELVYEVGPADDEAPSFDLDLWYDVYDHGEFVTGHDWCEFKAAQFSIDTRVEIDETVEAPLYFELFMRPRQIPDAWASVAKHWRLERDAHDPTGFHFSYALEDVMRVLPLSDAFCFEIRTADVAGNPGPSLERCPPCRDQLGEAHGGFVSMFPDTPPGYSNEWLYPDGYCPDHILDAEDGATTGGFDATSESSSGAAPVDPEPATSTDGDDGGDGAPGAAEVSARGCACNAGPPEDGARGWFGLVVLGVWRRRGGAPRQGVSRIFSAPRRAAWAMATSPSSRP